jgi:hypothetical protein
MILNDVPLRRPREMKYLLYHPLRPYLGLFPLQKTQSPVKESRKESRESKKGK